MPVNYDIANGFGRRRAEKDNSRMENKLQPGKSNPSRVTSITSGSTSEGFEGPFRDRLLYMTTCLIGHLVEVHVKNGSLFSGIFHATSGDKDFGVILKMARLIKDASPLAQKVASDSFGKSPSRTLIIQAHELVQIVAKDVPVTKDGLSNEIEGEKQRDIMLDSYISQSRHVELGRELAPWVPDDNDLQRPELENIFDSPWTGSWDQFKVNEKLFGVKSTFNEELYTTKLERGPRMRGIEEEAMRIAREIEGEETEDLHLAEERGTYPHANLDIDEETKYSSVYRGVDDSGYEEEDVMLNLHDAETFGDSAGPDFGRSFAGIAIGKNAKSFEGTSMSSGALSKDDTISAKFNANRELHYTGSLASDNSSMPGRSFEDENRMQDNHFDEQGANAFVEETVREQTLNEEVQNAKPIDVHSLLDAKRDVSEKVGVFSVAATSSSLSIKSSEKSTSGGISGNKSGKVPATEPLKSRGLPWCSASSTLDSGAATSAPTAPQLSPSSSVGSFSSERSTSTLNPNAKEFKLNPNAKSFVPTQTSLRPVSPVNDGSFYFPNTMPPAPHMHGMPVGIGVGPSFAGPQPVLFNPQAAPMQTPPAYYPANGPQYGQQIILGHPRQVMFMPGYPEMQYKGREY